VGQVQPVITSESDNIIIVTTDSEKGNYTDPSSSDADNLPSTQIGTAVIDVTELPYDIDGNITYRLPYNPEKK